MIKNLIIFCIFIVNLFAISTTKIAKISANSLYNLDNEQLVVTIVPFLKDDKNIKALKIIDYTDNSVFFQLYRKNNKFITSKIPSSFELLKKEEADIKYDDEVIGKVVVYRNKNTLLNEEEKKWIKNHIVTIGVEQWKPVVFSNNGDDIDGISGDFTKLIIKKTGLKVKIVNDKWDIILNQFKNKKIDILPATFYTKERATYGLYSKPYFQMKSFLYVRDDSDIKSFKDIKTLAIVKGYGTIPEIREKFPNIKIVETKDLLDSIDRVLNKKVDALYDGQVVVSYIIIKNLITGLKAIPQHVFPANNLYYFVNKDKPILLSIIQKALDSITPDERAKIIGKWLNLSNEIYLTKKEKEWLAKNITIKYTYDPDWKPIEWADDIKEQQGILRDILDIIIQRSGMNIKPVYSKDWHTILENIATKKVDAYSTPLYNNPNLNFTKHSILKVPYVFVTRIDSEYIDNIESIKNKKIGVFRESYIAKKIKQEYPDMDLVLFNKDVDGFKMLKDKKIDIAIFNVITAKYYLTSLGLNKKLKINDKTKYNLDLRIALNKDLGEIPLSIIDKALGSITKKELVDIIDKWTRVQVKKETDFTLILQIGGGLLSIVLLMVFYNYKLNQKVKEKTFELRTLLESFEKNVIASKTDKEGIITYVSDAFCDISGYSKEELIGKSHAVVISPEIREKLFHDIREKISTQKPWKGEIKQIKKNGEVYWVEAVVTPEYDFHNNFVGFSAIRHDITAKKELEKLSKNLEKIVEQRTQELAKQKAYLESIFENRGVGILITNEDRIITKVNQRLCELWGYKEDELVGNTPEILHISKEKFEEFGKKVFRQIRDGKKIEIEYQFKKKNGDIFWVKFYGEPLPNKEVLAVVNDITKEKKYQLNIEQLHKHTKESIEFASLIQGALLPEDELIDKFFKDDFVLWEPKDIVGGDIYLFEELRNENEALLMVIDCTGHGVPGAFVTMIVKAVEREIVSIIKEDKTMEVSPAWILSYFNKTIKRLLKQEDENAKSNAGFDGGIIYYDRRRQILKFAGAETPLFYLEDDELKTIKGDRYSVGYKKNRFDYEYKEHIIDVKEGMRFYLSTDGYLDQNGGEKGFPFGKKRFKKLIEENKNTPISAQKEIFKKALIDYQGDEERNDDITVVGFEIDKKSDVDVILEYEGILTQAIITHNIDILEHSIDNMGILGKLSTLVIEITQNMMKYSKTHEIGCRDIRPAGYIKITRIENRYIVESKNIVAVEDKEKIEKVLKEIDALDEKEIKKRYRELRRSGENTHENGGGIGFYEIAKLGKIEYDFEEINEDKFYFTMKVILKRR